MILSALVAIFSGLGPMQTYAPLAVAAAWVRTPCPDGRMIAADDPCPITPPRPRTVYFASGSAALSDDDITSLAEFALLLAATPDLRLEIRGHAQEQRDAAANARLSAARANAVATYFATLGVRPDQIRIHALGDAQPLIQGSSDPMNWRVELIFGRRGEPLLEF